jgi:hypothetical protein
MLKSQPSCLPHNTDSTNATPFTLNVQHPNLLLQWVTVLPHITWHTEKTSQTTALLSTVVRSRLTMYQLLGYQNRGSSWDTVSFILSYSRFSVITDCYADHFPVSDQNKPSGLESAPLIDDSYSSLTVLTAWTFTAYITMRELCMIPFFSKVMLHHWVNGAWHFTTTTLHWSIWHQLQSPTEKYQIWIKY